MDPELKQMLEETRALAKDTNRILHAMRREQWYGWIGKIIIWIIVLALPLYLYQHYLQPFVTQFTASSGITTSGPFALPTSADVQKLINSYKGGQ